MDWFALSQTDMKRAEKARGVVVQSFRPDHLSWFTVRDPKNHERVKYFGKISDETDHDQHCTCPDNTHRNTKEYRDSCPMAFQCKHQIAYRRYLEGFVAGLGRGKE